MAGAGIAMRKAWTTRELAIVRKMARDHTARETAEALGRSIGCVRKAANHYGITFQKYGPRHHKTLWSPVQALECVALREKGLTYRAIQDKLGIPVASAFDICRRYARKVKF